MTHIELFNRLSANRMQVDDVDHCLKMPQSEFLSMLSDEVSAQLKKTLSRIEFAELAGISKKSVYSYFASPTARDYRTLTDDARIAIIWRVITSVANTTPLNIRTSNSLPRQRAARYIVCGELMTLANAARALGYATREGLARRIDQSRTLEGDDISHLKIQRTISTEPRFFIVNGTEMSLNSASKALGYKSRWSLVLKIQKLSLPDGSDISQCSLRQRG